MQCQAGLAQLLFGQDQLGRHMGTAGPRLLESVDQRAPACRPEQERGRGRNQ